MFSHGVLERIAAAVDVPVVNLLSDRAHPCQALADLLTLRELFGAIEGRRLVYVGDGNNVAASLAFGAALTGLELDGRIATRATSSTTRSWTGPATSAASSTSSATRTKR